MIAVVAITTTAAAQGRHSRSSASGGPRIARTSPREMTVRGRPPKIGVPTSNQLVQQVLSKLKAGRIDPRQLRFETLQNNARGLKFRIYHQRSFAGKLEVVRSEQEAHVSFVGVHHQLRGKGLGLTLFLVAAQWAHDQGATLAKSDDTTRAADSLWQRLRSNGLADEEPRPSKNWTPNPESDGAYLRFRPAVFAGQGYRTLLDLLSTQPVPKQAPWAKEPEWRYSRSEFFRSGGPTIPTWASGEIPVT